MTDYAWGVLTPFIAIVALALAAAIVWLLAAAARILWSKVDYAFMSKTTLRKNRARIYLKGEAKDDLPEYLDAANKFRDALLESPKIYMVLGLGWRILLVREGSSAPADETVADTDEVLS